MGAQRERESIEVTSNKAHGELRPRNHFGMILSKRQDWEKNPESPKSKSKQNNTK